MTDDTQRCGTCTHYEPERNFHTGRPLPSYPGYCCYEVEWPELPICYRQGMFGIDPRGSIDWPRKGRPCRDTPATKCPFYEPKKRRRKDGAVQGKML